MILGLESWVLARPEIFLAAATALLLIYGVVRGEVATPFVSVMTSVVLLVTAALLWVVNFAMGLRVDEQSEQTGLDIAQHRERLGEAALPSLALVLVGLAPVLLLARTLRRGAAAP